MNQVVNYQTLSDVLNFANDPNRSEAQPVNLMSLNIYDSSQHLESLPFVPLLTRESKVAFSGLANHVTDVYRGVYKKNGKREDKALRAVAKTLVPNTSKYLEESINALIELQALTDETVRAIASPLIAKLVVGKLGAKADWTGVFADLHSGRNTYKGIVATATELVEHLPSEKLDQQVEQAIRLYKLRAEFWRNQFNGLAAHPIVEATIDQYIEKQQQEAHLDELSDQQAAM